MGDLTLFEALTGEAFDRLNWQHSGEFDQTFSKKSNARGFARGGGMGGFGIDPYISLLRKFWDFTIFVCSQIDSRLFRRKSFFNSFDCYVNFF